MPPVYDRIYNSRNVPSRASFFGQEEVLIWRFGLIPNAHEHCHCGDSGQAGELLALLMISVWTARSGLVLFGLVLFGLVWLCLVVSGCV